MAHKEQKQMLVDAIKKKSKDKAEDLTFLEFEYAQGYKKACEDILELIEGIL